MAGELIVALKDIVDLDTLSGLATIDAYRAFLAGRREQAYRLFAIRHLQRHRMDPEEIVLNETLAAHPGITPRDASRMVTDKYHIPLALSVMDKGIQEPIALRRVEGGLGISDGFNRACLAAAMGKVMVEARLVE